MNCADKRDTGCLKLATPTNGTRCADLQTKTWTTSSFSTLRTKSLRWTCYKLSAEASTLRNSTSSMVHSASVSARRFSKAYSLGYLVNGMDRDALRNIVRCRHCFILAQGVYTDWILSLPRLKDARDTFRATFAWGWGFQGSSSVAETFREITNITNPCRFRVLLNTASTWCLHVRLPDNFYNVFYVSNQKQFKL